MSINASLFQMLVEIPPLKQLIEEEIGKDKNTGSIMVFQKQLMMINWQNL